MIQRKVQNSFEASLPWFFPSFIRLEVFEVVLLLVTFKQWKKFNNLNSVAVFINILKISLLLFVYPYIVPHKLAQNLFKNCQNNRLEI